MLVVPRNSLVETRMGVQYRTTKQTKKVRNCRMRNCYCSNSHLERKCTGSQFEGKKPSVEQMSTWREIQEGILVDKETNIPFAVVIGVKRIEDERRAVLNMVKGCEELHFRKSTRQSTCKESRGETARVLLKRENCCRLKNVP